MGMAQLEVKGGKLLYVILLVLGLTLLNTWSDVIGHVNAFACAAALLDGPLSNGRMLFSSGLCTSAFLVAAAPEIAWQRRFALNLSATALAASASFLYAVSASLGSFSHLAAALGAFVVGAMYGWFEVRLLSLSVHRDILGIGGTLCCLAGSLVLKALLSGLVGSCPEVIQTAILIACPLTVGLGAVQPLSAVSGDEERVSVGLRNRREARTWLCFLLLGAILSAVARAVSNLGYWGEGYLVDASSVPFALVAAPVLFVVTWATLVRCKEDVAGLAGGLLVLLSGFLLLEIFDSNAISVEAYSILASATELYGHMLFWGLMVFSMGRMGMHPFRVVGAAEGTMSASAIALAALLVGVADSSRALIAISLYVGAAVALFLFRSANAEVEELEQARLGGAMPFDGSPTIGGGATVRAALVGPSDICALPGYSNLTERERDVCELLVQGRDRAFIAGQLGLSEGTVKTHMQHVYQKLGVHSKQELISAARGEDGGR